MPGQALTLKALFFEDIKEVAAKLLKVNLGVNFTFLSYSRFCNYADLLTCS